MPGALHRGMRLATQDEEAWFAQPEDVIALIDDVVLPVTRRPWLYALVAALVIVVCVGAFAL